MRVLSVGSLPPAWGGPSYGGVATLHATLLEGFLDPRSAVEVVGVVPPSPPSRELPVPVFAPRPGELTADFYERLLHELRPDAVIMHHFAHTIGVAHARLVDPPPAIGVAHSWHNVTFSSGEQRRRAVATTQEALSGLAAVVGMSRHCLREGEKLGLRYPSLVETIYHPLQPLYSAPLELSELERERRGIVCLGSLIPRKEPATLVRAAELLPGARVVFAGHGELEGDLRSLISSLSLGERVEIRDLDDGQARELLLGSEAMCLASRSETFGLAYIEALACGTPVVGFAPTLREIREEMGVEIGVGLDAASAQDVAAAIEQIRATAWDRGELRARALAAFDLGAATERYEGLIKKVTSRRATPRRSPLGSDDGPGATVVCVLGVSRAGTSLTARILNQAGVYLGAEDELLGGELHHLAGEGEDVVARAREANPEGFWEHYRLMRLNERILQACGGSWREPPALEPGWENSASLDDLRDEAQALIAESFDGHALWGWKDPRNSLTLPFWQRLLPEMRHVICVRHPLEVAESLRRRDGIELDAGIEQWIRYMAAALVNTSGLRRLFVNYEDYFRNPGALGARLGEFIGRGEPFTHPDGADDLASVIDERLWRSRRTPNEVAQLSREAASLFRVVELLCLPTESAGRLKDLDDASSAYASGLLGRLALVASP